MLPVLCKLFAPRSRSFRPSLGIARTAKSFRSLWVDSESARPAETARAVIPERRPGKRKEESLGVNRRKRNEESQQRRQEQGEAGKPIHTVDFSKEEIENEERKPKKKVAIMFGYAGSGYSGLQFGVKERTIEGDIFKACVLAGAVSKANADDAKKISWVRCARTDKGVHAAGNVISAKLIVEEDTVARINEKLDPQIRIWGIERTVGSFSAYQFVDSRIYEYLIPTFCFLPPHPQTFLGEQLLKLAQEAGDEQGYLDRQNEVSDFWSKAEETMRPVLEQYDPEVREKAVDIILNGGLQSFKKALGATMRSKENATDVADAEQAEISEALADAVKNIKKAFKDARTAYRMDEARLARVRSCLNRFAGTYSYHNYTVLKKRGDPSAKRHIKSFVPSEKPFLINGTEWLSLKVHGQSFMMHQIRKMVFMAASIVRCGTDQARLDESFTTERLNVPKAPGLGLLLERPIFDAYNEKKRGAGPAEYAPVEFDPYQAVIDEFKQREIYERIYREEEQDGQFYYLWTSVDSHKSTQLLYLSSKGLGAVDQDDWKADRELAAVVSDDENDAPEDD